MHYIIFCIIISPVLFGFQWKTKGCLPNIHAGLSIFVFEN